MVAYTDEPGRPYHLGAPALPKLIKTLLITHVAVHFALLLGWKLFAAIDPQGIYKVLGLYPPYGLGSGFLWQFVTYMFVHDLFGVFHLLFNLLILYFFAAEMHRLHGKGGFLALYFGGGALAGLVHCLVSYSGGALIGASAGVYAVMVAYAVFAPRQRILLFFIIPIELWVAVAILIGIDMAQYLSQPGDGIAHLAHLVGAAWGYSFARWGNPLRSLQVKAQAYLGAKQQQRERALDDNVDGILDKIHKQGMSALTEHEKQVLKKASKRYQKR